MTIAKEELHKDIDKICNSIPFILTTIIDLNEQMSDEERKFYSEDYRFTLISYSCELNLQAKKMQDIVWKLVDTERRK